MRTRYTPMQIVLEVLAFLTIVLMFVFLWRQWNSLPDQLPLHYSFSGKVDRWGTKTQMLLLPLMSLGVYLLITVVNFFPRIWNMPYDMVLPQNREAMYRCVRSMILVLKWFVTLIFAYLTVAICLIRPLTPWFMPIALVLIFGDIVYYLLKAKRLAGA